MVIIDKILWMRYAQHTNSKKSTFRKHKWQVYIETKIFMNMKYTAKSIASCIKR